MVYFYQLNLYVDYLIRFICRCPEQIHFYIIITLVIHFFLYTTMNNE